MAYQSRTASGLDTQRGEAWDSRAACRDVDPEMFFQEGKGRLPQHIEVEAKAVCRRCPVLTECGAWVRDHPQEFGIFAGLTPAQRKARAAETAHRPAVRWCPQCSAEFQINISDPFQLLCRGCTDINAIKARRAQVAAAGTPDLYHCANGHAFDETNTRQTGNGRKCRRCNSENQASRRAALKVVSP